MALTRPDKAPTHQSTLRVGQHRGSLGPSLLPGRPGEAALDGRCRERSQTPILPPYKVERGAQGRHCNGTSQCSAMGLQCRSPEILTPGLPICVDGHPGPALDEVEEVLLVPTLKGRRASVGGAGMGEKEVGRTRVRKAAWVRGRGSSTPIPRMYRTRACKFEKRNCSSIRSE